MLSYSSSISSRTSLNSARTTNSCSSSSSYDSFASAFSTFSMSTIATTVTNESITSTTSQNLLIYPAISNESSGPINEVSSEPALPPARSLPLSPTARFPVPVNSEPIPSVQVGQNSDQPISSDPLEFYGTINTHFLNYGATYVEEEDRPVKTYSAPPGTKRIVPCTATYFRRLLKTDIGPFYTEAAIGDGTYSSVDKIYRPWTIRDTNKGLVVYLREYYVLKTISKELVTAEEAFENEIEALSHISHPNIIKMFGYFEDDLRFFLVNQYIDGLKLSLLKERYTYLHEDAVLKIAKQLLAAIKVIHDRGMIHRDLTLDNVIFKNYDIHKNTEVCVIGFCDSCFVDEQGRGFGKVGHSQYMAPEVYRTGEKGYTNKVDVWSFGVMMFTLLACNKKPYDLPRSEIDVINWCGGRYFPAWPEQPCYYPISRNATDFVGRCLQFNPNNRSSVDQLLQHPWIAFGTGDNITPVTP